ncbi:hypothetical protein [Pedobacter sp. ASV28]|uniref:hypothetical protein n=1 Tax=Pedobacter sp. ASV28 TaxID=2795123 RepID=UPI0018ED79FB|nr:hypothetical protein [Pedobacter sp. ASV28]
MQDKDFDNLFRDKFIDAEVEPSTNLWSSIEQQLEPKRRRSLPIFWMAAASVAVIASVMLFTQRTEKLYLHAPEQEVAKALTAQSAQEILPVVSEMKTTSSKVLALEASDRKATKVETAKVKSALFVEDEKNIQVVVQPNVKEEHLPIKKSEVRPLEINPIVAVPEENTTKMIAANPQNNNTDEIGVEAIEELNNNKKGIRNMGDLINFVVEKVDKREKKLIKFDTDDDDNSSIIGLNIGFVKLNKKNK